MVNNIILLTVDSLRYDHFPGNDENIENQVFSKLKSEGVSFENAYATGPGTTCSFPALLTGTLPLSYGGLGPLSSDRPRVAQRLGNSGFDTAGFQTNPFLSTHFNYDVGFDTFKDYQNPLMGVVTKLFPRGIEVNNPKLRKIDEALNLTGLLKSAYQTMSGQSRPYVSADVITNDVINWLQETDGKFFCWAHYMDVHHPCFPPKKIRQQFGVEGVTASQVSDWYSTILDSPSDLSEDDKEDFKRIYDASINYTNQQIGRIVDELKSTERWEDTLVILTSDHGELFDEYESYGKPVRMYDELLRVPLVVVNGPSYLEDHQNDLVSLLDIPPLIHDILDEDVPDQYEGRLLKAPSPREYVLAEHQIEDEVVVGARTVQRLYEYNGPKDEVGFFEAGPKTFEKSPEHEHDNKLKNAVNDRIDIIDVTVDTADLDAEVEDRLADLGYLDN